MAGAGGSAYRAFSAEDSVALLSRPVLRASVPATGPGLFALMALRLAGPQARAGLGDPADLSYVSCVRGELRIGSLTRHADLSSSALACQHLAILADVGRVLTSRGMRRSETVGGILCQAGPAEDLAAVFAAVRATMLISGRGGTRAVPAREFRLGPGKTVVEPGELLTEIRIPIRPCGSAYEKTVTRPGGGCPVTGAAAVLCLDGGTVIRAGLGLTPAPARQRGLAEAEELMAGALTTRLGFEGVGEIASRYCACSADVRQPGSGQCAAGRLITRALRRALLRARA